ncbi:Ig-like domain repeat protein [Streptomyces sp. CB03238]|uniref:Ig-like domain repeat protein n=1 Tax=Streptomyces sp. CB03238 TaxID=1907777 RepID=UPI001F4D7B22|nr:Ig-like domain repeat protein [Streptomyces sp. CB03238]
MSTSVRSVRSRRRVTSALVALSLTLGTGGLVAAAAPAAYAADASEVVAKLPISSYSAMVVDSARERVYIADKRSYWYERGQVLVYNFQGQQVATLTGASPVSGLAMSADGATLYAGERESVAAYDTATLQVTGRTSVHSDTCGRELAFSGGKQWHTRGNANYESECAYAVHGLDSISGGAYNVTGWNVTGRMLLETGAGAENRLFMGQVKNEKATDPALTSFDTSGDNPVRGDSRRFADAEGKGGLDLKDLAVSADGKRLAVADAAHGTRLLNSGDLSDAPAPYQPLPADATASAVAFSGDGKYIARGASATGSTPDLLIQPADPANGTTALEFAYEGELDGNRVVPRGLEWSADGSRLFALTTNAPGNAFWLHVIQPPAAQYHSRFTGGLTSTQAVVGEPVGIRGRLELDGPAPAEPVKVTAVRTDADGTRKTAPAEVAADGTFTVLDVPARVGESTYTLSFLGDLTHRPAEDVSLTVSVAKAPSAITLTAPAEASKSAGLEITGTFTAQGPALPAGITLAVQRADRLGTGTLTSVAVAADGTFRINDLPRTRGSVTYTVSYAGDDVHAASSAEATVWVRR